MGISTFGGSTGGSTGGSSGSTVEEIGSIKQFIGGSNWLPCDGRLILKSQYPAYSALVTAQNVATPVTLTVGNASMPSALAFYVTSHALNNSFVYLGASSTFAGYQQAGSTVISATTLPISGTWRGIVSNGTLCLALGANTSALTYDGATWTNGQLSHPTSYDLPPSVIGNTFWISESSRHYTGSSTDGVTWDLKGMGLGNVSKIIKAGSRYIAMQSNTNAPAATDKVCVSTDGVNWVTKTLPSTDTMRSIAYTNGIICMVGSARIYTSTDGGENWTATTNPFGALTTVTSFTATSTTFMLVATFAGVAGIRTSTDGINWSTLAGALSVLAKNVTWTGTMYVMPVSGANIVLTSTDGITWSAATLPAYSDWATCVWTGTTMVLLANVGTSSAISTDGVNWSIGSASVPAAVGQRGRWEANGSNNVFVVLNTGSSTAAIRSTDGITWTTVSLPTASVWQSIAAVGSTFVAVSGAGTCASSPDGANWTTRTGTTGTDVTSNGTTFVSMIIGNTTAACLFTSTDGTNWTARNQTVLVGNDAILYNGTTLVLVGSNKQIQTSTDGITWVNQGQSSTLGAFSASAVALSGRSNAGSAIIINTISNGLYVHRNSSDSTGLNWTGYFLPVPNTTATITYAGNSTTIIGIAGGLKFTYTNASPTFVCSLLPNNQEIHRGLYAPIIYSDGKFVLSTTQILGRGIAPYYIASTDGVTWTKTTVPSHSSTPPVYVNGKAIISVVVNGGVTIFTSADQITWSSYLLPSVAAYYAGGDGQKSWIFTNSTAPGALRSQFGYTTDGYTILHTTPPYSAGGKIAYNGTVAVAGGVYAFGISSDQGNTWQYYTAPIATSTGVLYHQPLNMFVVTAGTLTATSIDGLNWSVVSMPSGFVSGTAMSFGRTIIIGGAAATPWAYSNNGSTWTAFTNTPGNTQQNFAQNVSGTLLMGSPLGATNGVAVTKGYDDALYTQLPTSSVTPVFQVKVL